MSSLLWSYTKEASQDCLLLFLHIFQEVFFQVLPCNLQMFLLHFYPTYPDVIFHIVLGSFLIILWKVSKTNAEFPIYFLWLWLVGGGVRKGHILSIYGFDNMIYHLFFKNCKTQDTADSFFYTNVAEKETTIKMMRSFSWLA